MSRLKGWKIMQTSCRAWRSWRAVRRVISRPFTMTEPEVGRSSRFMHRTRVDLPAPERPMMPKISPASIVRSMSSRAWTAFGPVPKVLFSPWIWMMGSLTCVSSFLSVLPAADERPRRVKKPSLTGCQGRLEVIAAVPPWFARPLTRAAL